LKEKYFKRFNLNQRIQHVVLLVAFAALAITGLPLKFHDWSISQSLMTLLGGADVTRLIHRYAAFTFAGVFFFHLLYLMVRALVERVRIRKLGIKRVYPIFPDLQDLRDFFRLAAHYLGFIRRPPKFGHYDMFQKFEYWAGMWGFIIMIVTGLINWFPVTATGFLPGWFIPLSLSLHGWEAVLAVLSVALIHLYSTVWSPRIFPIDASIWSGNISRERIAEEHPLEYEHLTKTNSKES
jgi:cytochrome b subunit of formate dehydrogenase